MRQEIIGRDFFIFGKYAMMVTNCTKGFGTLWYPSMKIWEGSCSFHDTIWVEDEKKII